MNSTLEILILAAGKGTRMRSDLPKVLHKLAGKALLGHVVDAAHALGAAQTCVVYGFGGEAVPQAMADEKLTFVLQAEQHGTGHAVKQALPKLSDDGVTLVLYGDVPLTHVATLEPLVTAAQNGKLGLLTVTLAHPDGYGRIVRENGRVTRIVEHKDASSAERAIQEVNTGILAVATRHLKQWIESLKNNNAQGEYYLTDIIALAVRDGVSVETHQPAHEWEVLGVNSKAQLAELERIHQNEIAQALLNDGVTLFDPARLDVRGSLTCGRDVVIDVNCVFEGTVVLGDGVQVGANCVLRNATVAAGTRLDAFTLIDDAQIGEANRLGPVFPHPPRHHAGARCPRGQLRRDQEQPGRCGLQGQPPVLHRRHHHGQKGQHRRRHHHLQLRWCLQAPHRNRGRGVRRLRYPAGRARDRGQRRHPGRRHDPDQGCARRAN